MKKCAAIVCLSAIILIALALRLYRIESVPPGFYLDEASFGYNAYSILKTGRDEFGVRMPLFTASFGSGKNPVQLYATVASVTLFGLNETATRLPSAVFGTLTVLFAFLFAAELFHDRRAGLAAALLCAVSPWHVHFFSRAGFEPMTMVCFITLGAWLAVLGLRKKWALPAAGAAFGVSLYCYAPAFVFVPLFSAFFIGIYFQQLKGRAVFCLAGAALFAILALPHLSTRFKTQEQNTHFIKDTVFNPQHDAHSKALLERARVPGAAFIERNPLLLRTAAFARNYFSSISYGFLFASGDTSTTRASVKGFGVLYRAEFFLLIAGLVLAVRRRSKPLLLITAWLVIAPVASAMTYQWVTNSCRAITFIPGCQVLFGYALVEMYSAFSKDASRRGAARIFMGTAAVAISVYLAFNIFSFFNYYFNKYPADSAVAWQYGFREAFEFAEENSAKYPNVIVSMNLGYSYIHTLFYTKYDPAALQREQPLAFAGPPDRSGFYAPRIGRLGRYFVGPPQMFKSDAPMLYILAVGEMPELKTVKVLSLDGAPPLIRLAESVPALRDMHVSAQHAAPRPVY